MRHGHAFLPVLLQLVAQGADRDAEDVGGVGAVAEAMLQGLEDQVALDIGDGAADEAGLAPRRAIGGDFGTSASAFDDGSMMASGPISSPRPSSTARCMAFSSSRTLPRQACCVSISRTRGGERRARQRRWLGIFLGEMIGQQVDVLAAARAAAACAD